MAYEQRDNSGSLFKNDDKSKPEANPNWADYKGSIMVGGVQYWLSAWLKTGKSGVKFMSLSVQPKAERAQAAPAPAATAAEPFPDDDIPF